MALTKFHLIFAFEDRILAFFVSFAWVITSPIGLLAYLLRRWARGVCQGGPGPPSEDMVGALGLVDSLGLGSPPTAQPG